MRRGREGTGRHLFAQVDDASSLEGDVRDHLVRDALPQELDERRVMLGAGDEGGWVTTFGGHGWNGERICVVRESGF